MFLTKTLVSENVPARKTDDKPYNPSKRLREILVELIQCAMLGQSKKGKFKHTET